jgi:hypothetical protein
LRQTILNFAVLGKLEQQAPEDEHSEALLTRIRKIKKDSTNRTKRLGLK